MGGAFTENLDSDNLYHFSTLCYVRLLLHFVQQPTLQTHWQIYCVMF